MTNQRINVNCTFAKQIGFTSDKFEKISYIFNQVTMCSNEANLLIHNMQGNIVEKFIFNLIAH